MPDHSAHRASDLARDERLIVERWLGRALSNDETISMSAYRPHEAPGPRKRQSLQRKILDQARETGSRAGDISDQESDDVLGEAFDSIRAHGR